MKAGNVVLMGLCAIVLGMPVLAAAQADVADAAMVGDVEAVRSLIEQSADVNAPHPDGATAMHWAAYLSDAELVRELITAGADVSVANRNGSTPLWLAAINGDAAIMRMLLDAGAEPNEQLPLGRTPLMIAARTGNPDAVAVLIEHGADVNARDGSRGTTPLMWAADQGHAAAAVVLIENGADVSALSDPAERNARNNIGKDNDPRGSVRDQVQRILDAQEAGELGQRPASGLPGQLQREQEGEQQADADDGTQGGFSGFGAPDGDEAAPDGDEAAPEAQPGDADFQGFERRRNRVAEDGGQITPLVYAARSNAIDLAQVLIEAGADVNQLTGYDWSPLLAATQNRNYQLGAFFIENGADVNLANEGGWTPLYLATDNRNIEDGDYPTREPDMDHLEYIRLLLDAGAEPNARMSDSTETRTVFTNQWLDEDGATAFFRASQSGDIELMRLLLEHGAEPDINTELNVTPLQVAAGIGWVEGVTTEHSTEETIEAVQLLLDLGVDPNAQADTGRTALHGAGHKGSTEVVRMLVDAGAQLDVRDYGNTDNRGSPELAAHTWLPLDYADGLVRVGVQSSIPHPETAEVIRGLMVDRGLTPPPFGRTLDSICIVEVCDLTGYEGLAP